VIRATDEMRSFDDYFKYVATVFNPKEKAKRRNEEFLLLNLNNRGETA